MDAQQRSSLLDAVQHKALAAALPVDRNPLAEDWRRVIGGAIERALVLAQVTKQEASYAMGYRDQSALSRWIAGDERPHFDKLWAIEALRTPLVLTFAELAGSAVEIKTVVTIERRIA